MTAKIEPEQVWRFMEAISQDSGLALDESRHAQLKNILNDRLRACRIGDANLYLEKLKDHEFSRTEMQSAAESLTVAETYFFRHQDQIDAFMEVALPACLARTRPQRLHILCAGCASGEEPYTLAIALRELLPEEIARSIEIVGIDISATQLQRAREGIYSQWSLRATPASIRDNYFLCDGKNYRLHDSIRKAVDFRQRNIVEDDSSFWINSGFDIIFCRNVLMYFLPGAMQSVVEKFSRSISREGFLFLGPAETLRGVSRDFHLCHSHNTFYYQRPAIADRAPPQHLPLPGRPARTAPPPPEPYRAEAHPSWMVAIDKASRRIADLLQAPALVTASAAPDSLPASIGRDYDLAPVLELLGAERYGDALTLLRGYPPAIDNDPDAQLLLSVALTQLGEIELARQVCQQILLADELNVGAHYIMALCASHQGDVTAALEHVQTAAYLDTDFALAQLHLGLVAKSAGNQQMAGHAFKRAHDLLETEELGRILLFGGGFNRAALQRLCQAELAALGGKA